MHTENSLALPAFGRGWVCSQTNRGTNIRLEDGTLVYTNKRPELLFGQAVTTILHRRLRGGTFVGEIYDAQVLPPVERPDRRHVALIDESNICGLAEPSNPAKWRHGGACKAFAVGIGLEGISRRPFFIADRCCRRGAYDLHAPSARAIAAIQARPGWTRRTYDFGVKTQNADIAAFSLLFDNPSAVLVTGTEKYDSGELRRRFPNIDEVRHRIHGAVMVGNRIEIPALGISEVVPLPLFSQAGR